MLRLFTMSLALLGMATVVHAEPRTVPPEVLAKIHDLEPDGLPRTMTDRERSMTFDMPDLPARGAPPGNVDCPAEYDPMDGIFIRWGYLQRGTDRPDGAHHHGRHRRQGLHRGRQPPRAQQRSVHPDIGAGADMIASSSSSTSATPSGCATTGRATSRERFRTIVDHTYNRPSRWRDNGFPDHIASSGRSRNTTSRLVHGGGNFHLFANGEAFMTDLMIG
jgi:hypothetical protein